MNSSEHMAQLLCCSYNLVMHRELKVIHNDIMRRLLGVAWYTSGRILFVNARQDKINVLIRKQCYSLKHRVLGYYKVVNKSIFESCTFNVLKLLDN